jgi:uncharacterized membrane protein
MRSRLIAALTITAALLVALPTAAGAQTLHKEKCVGSAGQIANHCKGGK